MYHARPRGRAQSIKRGPPAELSWVRAMGDFQGAKFIQKVVIEDRINHELAFPGTIWADFYITKKWGQYVI